MTLTFSSYSNEELDDTELPTRRGDEVETLFIDNGNPATSFLNSKSSIDIAMLRQLSIKLNREHYVGLAGLLPYAASLQRLEVKLAPYAIEGPGLTFHGRLYFLFFTRTTALSGE
ncbi:hypothetical protein Hypma_003183 [Hypsizygus marmoreus]|uniref:Uncharacterized protein n=1 Tax=Hypsizygus marmoreus TaxID=39966 RepID=A0A369K744_HYPMA|nr:hypothetical protein Hypma_003183 [Hypsizygus marmoreus]